MLHNCRPWSFDVWSLGIVIVEIICGFPVWLHGNYSTIDLKGNKEINRGLLAVKDRKFDLVLEEQTLSLLTNQSDNLDTLDHYGLFKKVPGVKSLLIKMLRSDPAERISPKEIISELENI